MMIIIQQEEYLQVLKALIFAAIVITACALVILILIAIFVKRAFARPVKNAITNLNGAAALIDENATKVAEISGTIAQGAADQAAGIEESPASLEEMSAMTRQNADRQNLLQSS